MDGLIDMCTYVCTCVRTYLCMYAYILDFTTKNTDTTSQATDTNFINYLLVPNVAYPLELLQSLITYFLTN